MAPNLLGELNIAVSGYEFAPRYLAVGLKYVSGVPDLG
jgi:hypothetical protein